MRIKFHPNATVKTLAFCSPREQIAAPRRWGKPRSEKLDVGVVGVLLPIGWLLLSYFSASVGPFVFGLGYCLVGLAVVKAVSFAVPSRPELRGSFLACYAVCTSVAGLAEAYALWRFQHLQTAIDAVAVFYPLSQQGLENGAFQQININAPLAVWIWQYCYELSARIGFGTGPWVGVLFNSLLISLACTTILASAELIGNGDKRARDIRGWCVYGAFFWLAAATHLRDAFVVCASATVVFLALCLLARPSLPRLVIVTIGQSATIGITVFVRQETAYALGAIAVWGLVCTILLAGWKRAQADRAVVTLLLLAFVGILIPLIMSGRALWEFRATNIAEDNLLNSSDDSLGSRFVVRAAVPVRMLLGTYTLFVHPIPLFKYVGLSQDEYTWLTSLAGICMVGAVPYLLDGLITRTSGKTQRAAKWFLSGALGFGTIGIVFTTMDHRHLMQFVPMALLLMVFSLPDSNKRRRRLIYELWYASVLLAHAGWMVLKF